MIAHLPIREVEGRIDITGNIQDCVVRANRYRRAATTMNVVTALGGASILALLSFLTSPIIQETSIRLMVNTSIFYSMISVAILLSFIAALQSVFTPERMSVKFATALRALRQLRDTYEFELGRNPDDENWKRELEIWGKSNVYEIENLLEDDRVFDINFHLKISDPPQPTKVS